MNKRANFYLNIYGFISFLIGITCIALLTVAGCFNKGNEDSQKFKDEYESINNKVNEKTGKKNRELTINDVVRRSKKYVYVSGRNKTVHWESTCLNDGGGETRSIEKTEFKRKLEQGGYSGYIACPICDRTAFYISRKKKLIHINPDCTNAIKDEVFEEVNKQELPSEYNRCKICFSLQ